MLPQPRSIVSFLPARLAASRASSRTCAAPRATLPNPGRQMYAKSSGYASATTVNRLSSAGNGMPPPCVHPEVACSHHGVEDKVRRNRQSVEGTMLEVGNRVSGRIHVAPGSGTVRGLKPRSVIEISHAKLFCKTVTLDTRRGLEKCDASSFSGSKR